MQSINVQALGIARSWHAEDERRIPLWRELLFCNAVDFNPHGDIAARIDISRYFRSRYPLNNSNHPYPVTTTGSLSRWIRDFGFYAVTARELSRLRARPPKYEPNPHATNYVYVMDKIPLIDQYGNSRVIKLSPDDDPRDIIALFRTINPNALGCMPVYNLKQAKTRGIRITV